MLSLTNNDSFYHKLKKYTYRDWITTLIRNDEISNIYIYTEVHTNDIYTNNLIAHTPSIFINLQYNLGNIT
jgi:hypothetical protein